MPDHQIVIKLDSEQFDEAQRLAKGAGFRSASSFIRERIVTIIEKTKDNPDAIQDMLPELPGRIKKIDSDISRIQQELQIFIAEQDQINSSQLESIPENITDSKAPEPDFPIFSDQVGATFSSEQTNDSDERLQSKLEAREIATFTKEPDQESNEKEKNSWRSNEELPVSEEEIEEKTEPVSDPPEGPDQKQTDSSPTEPEIQTENEQPNPSNSSNQPDLEEVLEAVNEANDELEEMADRAFSISPRLGPIEPKPVPTQVELLEDDPLADLLDEHLVDKIISPTEETLSEEDNSDLDPEETEPATTTETEADSNVEVEAEAPNVETDTSDDIEHNDSDKEDETTETETETKATETDSDTPTEPNKEDDSETDLDTASADDEKQSKIPTLEGENQIQDEDPKHDLRSGPPPKRRRRRKQ